MLSSATLFDGPSDTILLAACLVFLLALLSLVAWGAWRAYNPLGRALYAGMWFFLIFTGACAVNSTWPSSAPRRTATGIIAWIVTHKSGRSESFTLGLQLPSGTILPFRASATPPFFAQRRDLVSVTYLDEKVANEYPRAIGFRVLSGPRSGYQDFVSADWLGPWLGVLFGPICGFAALWKAYSNRRPKAEEPPPSLSIAS